ncbi:MAG TPA: hypothetical protein VGK20_15190 [Candidatus Binatia bacterium]|jgi:hypothetical protein
MSIPVELHGLRDAVARFGPAPYLLTVAADGRPHSVSVHVQWDGDDLVAKCGGRSLANVAARPLVSLLWSPVEAGGYSLILDGDGSVRGEGDESRAVIYPTRAVMHRPAQGPVPEGRSCSDDCVPILR